MLFSIFECSKIKGNKDIIHMHFGMKYLWLLLMLVKEEKDDKLVEHERLSFL